MNCNHYEQYILLEESGEITGEQSIRLQAHLASCEHCRAFKADMTLLQDASRCTNETELQVSEFTQYLIKTEALNALKQHTATYPTTRLSILWPWRPVYAVAAALIISLGLFLLTRVNNQQPATPQQYVTQNITANKPVDAFLSWDDDFDSKIDALDTELTIASSTMSVEEYYSDLDTADTDDLANELLLLEESS